MANRVDPRLSSSQTRKGQTNGLKEEVNGGPINEKEISTIK
jgi:hypothetical protein